MRFKTAVAWGLFFCLSLVFLGPRAGWGNRAFLPVISAESAVLMDVDTGQILYSKNHLQQRPMASTTKVMTALIALAAADTDGIIKISPRAAAVGESSMYLREGEALALKHVLYGALLRSGNDACVAIAEHAAGSEEAFVLLMNEKAALIGADSTHFCNTNGLPAPGHYSTAQDLALIARNALHDPLFCRIVKTRFKTVKGLGGVTHYLKNTNKLLWQYPGADGVKTGTTMEAGKCLIASATVDDRRLLAVILNGPDRFRDAENLLDYGFNEFKAVRAAYAGEIYGRVQVLNGLSESVPARIANDITINIHSDGVDEVEKKVTMLRSVQAPVREGQLLGKITVIVNGAAVDSSLIVAESAVGNLSPVRKLTNKVINTVIR
ncbi:D-alanyl-D-alanine carboxypeptidase family protein [Desulfoscipio geothermicus]|uniref:serine-type D-Ala-D-Ala carboxypeptidase n=1 Tax=Desulfoscipio geothermicus DSM 3669 TaxID=1121426 RepID=A0A1I6D8T5_9FIRM|nr:D-alanyl-D-alanine carboxypeptidase family protein [Desulfoscipio geothermicus]SFR01767.1 D-alanyl-D-alanine carboxypeptidase (penicillin-binding protein 5/6) [Desulfoscipio geothermicus DSM 3669]